MDSSTSTEFRRDKTENVKFCSFWGISIRNSAFSVCQP